MVDRLGRDLGLAWPASADPTAVAASLVPTGRHQRADDVAFLLDQTVPGPVRDLYAAAIAAVAAGQADDLSPAVDDAAAALDGEPMARFVADLEAEHRADVIARNRQIDHLSSHLAKGADAGAAAHAAYVEHKARADDLATQLADARGRVEHLEVHLRKGADAGAAAHAAFVEHKARADEVAAQLADARRASAAAAVALAERDQAVSVARADAERLRADGDRNRADGDRNRADGDRARADAAQRAAAADRKADALARDVAAVRAELATAYHTRDTLGESFRNLLRSRLWTWGPPGRGIARALGMLRVGGDRLVPLSPGPSGAPMGRGTARPPRHSS